mmetsp:Transcript_98519/g.254671  ORF Transcript_98519/g.254671 Transcript_98519/m.254671 type:complete len:339 (+) Transcript_98519:921-1937(+)
MRRVLEEASELLQVNHAHVEVGEGHRWRRSLDPCPLLGSLGRFGCLLAHLVPELLLQLQRHNLVGVFEDVPEQRHEEPHGGLVSFHSNALARLLLLILVQLVLVLVLDMVQHPHDLLWDLQFLHEQREGLWVLLLRREVLLNLLLQAEERQHVLEVVPELDLQRLQFRHATPVLSLPLLLLLPVLLLLRLLLLLDLPECVHLEAHDDLVHALFFRGLGEDVLRPRKESRHHGSGSVNVEDLFVEPLKVAVLHQLAHQPVRPGLVVVEEGQLLTGVHGLIDLIGDQDTDQCHEEVSDAGGSQPQEDALHRLGKDVRRERDVTSLDATDDRGLVHVEAVG